MVWRVITIDLILLPEEHLIPLTVAQTVTRSHIIHVIRHEFVYQHIRCLRISRNKQSCDLAWFVHRGTVIWHRIQEVGAGNQHGYGCSQ